MQFTYTSCLKQVKKKSRMLKISTAAQGRHNNIPSSLSICSIPTLLSDNITVEYRLELIQQRNILQQRNFLQSISQYLPKQGKEWPGKDYFSSRGRLMKLTTQFLNSESCHCSYTKSRHAYYVVIISSIFSNSAVFFSYSVSVFHFNLSSSLAAGPQTLLITS